VLVSTYLISAFLPGSWVRGLQIALFLVAVLIAVQTSRASRRVTQVASCIVLGGSAIALALTRATPNGPAAGAAFAWIALMLLLAVVLIIRRVLMTRSVTLQSIFAAISAYMLIGLMFAAGYAAISKFVGDPFFANGQPEGIATFQYFSFSTLTTVGYGDFTAAAASGRAVAVLEALSGQVFLTTLVARLVSAYGQSRPAASRGRRRHPVARQRRAAGNIPAAKSRCHRSPRTPRHPPSAGAGHMTWPGRAPRNGRRPDQGFKDGRGGR
jgi:hypothetical protein